MPWWTCDADRLFLCSQVNHSLVTSENGSKIFCSRCSHLLEATDLKHVLTATGFYPAYCWKISSLGLLSSSIPVWEFASKVHYLVSCFLKHDKLHVLIILFLMGCICSLVWFGKYMYMIFCSWKLQYVISRPHCRSIKWTNAFSAE